MKYDVRFSQPSFHLNRRRLLNCFGTGTVYLLETGLVADGQMPRVNLPFIDRIYHGVISAPTSRSIPYSTILQHGVMRPWFVWIAKAFLLTVFSLVLVGLIAGLIAGASSYLLIPVVIVAGLMVVTVVTGRPAYHICCHDQNGRKQELYIGFRRRTEQLQFQKDLMRVVDQARQSAHPEAATFIQNAWQRSSQRSVATPQTRGAVSWMVSMCVHAWIWGCAALLTAFLLHISLSTAASGGSDKYSMLKTARSAFYDTGIQISALLSSRVVVSCRTADDGSVTYLQAGSVIAFWTLLATVAGAAAGLARPTPKLSRVAIACACWLPIVVVVTFAGWKARQYLLSWNAEPSAAMLRAQRAERGAAAGVFFQYRGSAEEARQRRLANVRRMVAEYVRLARGFEEQSRTDEAEREFQKALELSQKERDSQQEIALLTMMGQRLHSRGDQQQAQNLFAQAITQSKATGTAGRELAVIYNLSALNLDSMGRSNEAGNALREALSVLRAAGDINSSHGVVTRVNYGSHLVLASDLMSAQPQFDESVYLISVSNNWESMQPRDAQNCYVASANNLLALQRWGEAFNHASQAVRVSQQQETADHDVLPEIATSIQAASFQSMAALLVGLMILGSLALSMSLAAGKRGYNAPYWFVVTALSGFPMANLVVLASIPDRRLDLRRLEIRSQLNGLVRTTGSRITHRDSNHRTIGDLTTLE